MHRSQICCANPGAKIPIPIQKIALELAKNVTLLVKLAKGLMIQIAQAAEATQRKHIGSMELARNIAQRISI